MIFLYRRLIFVSSVILLRTNILALLLILVGLIQFSMAVFHLLKPLESRGALLIQTIDECTYLLLVYLIMCFTNFVPDPEYRINIGVAYISVIGTNIGIHLYILINQP